MKTDNSYFEEKINLRLDAVNKVGKQTCRILECYAGEGVIWDCVRKKTDKELLILRIEKEKNKGDKVYLQGDNLKYLKSLDLSKFDIIDLDAYGIPFSQIDILVKRGYKGIVVVTAIQSVKGTLPYGLLEKNGYSKTQIKKCPTLFARNGMNKLKNYLYAIGVKSVYGYFIERKNYFMFELS